jgi:hypothetical protein
MTSPADTPIPAGITWAMAMTKAGEILSSLPERPKKPQAWDSYAVGAAQAWIAFARELTMHARAAQ